MEKGRRYQCPVCGTPMYINEGGEKNYLACGICGMKIFLTRRIVSLTPLHTAETTALFNKKWRPKNYE